MPTITPPQKPVAPSDSGFRLTGRHVFIILCCFFGVMLAVNLTMARFALTTFSGEVTSHPYEKGLKFNADIAASRAQEKLGWRVEGRATRGADGVALVEIEARDASNAPLSGLEIVAALEAPADRKRDKILAVRETAPGAYAARGPAEAGAWDLVMIVKRDGELRFQSRNRITLN